MTAGEVSGSVTLRWDPVETADGYIVCWWWNPAEFHPDSNHELPRYKPSEFWPSCTGVGDVVEWVWELPPGGPWYVSVAAYNGAGESTL